MENNRYKDDENRAVVATLIVSGGDDIGFSAEDVPGYMLNKIHNVFKEFLDWQNDQKKGEKK